MMVKSVGGITAPQAGAGKGGATTSGFTVRGETQIASGPAGVAATACLDGLLLLQEGDSAPTRDRRARQHGRAMLDALARLQLGLLGDGDGSEALGLLTSLVDNCPEASDPGLRDLLGAVSLRARLEVVRRTL